MEMYDEIYWLFHLRRRSSRFVSVVWINICFFVFCLLVCELITVSGGVFVRRLHLLYNTDDNAHIIWLNVCADGMLYNYTRKLKGSLSCGTCCRHEVPERMISDLRSALICSAALLLSCSAALPLCCSAALVLWCI